MTLRKKTLFIIGLTLCGLVILLLGISRNILLNGFTEIEKGFARQNTERAIKAITREIEEIKVTSCDWAFWDDTYKFVQDGNKAFIDSNLNDAAIVTLKLNVMLYLNTTGKIIYGKEISPATNQAVPLSDGLKKYLSEHPKFIRPVKEDSCRAGIINLPEGPILLVSQPILTSERKGPIRGCLVFGRYLSDMIIKRLATMTEVDIRIHRLDTGGLSPALQEVITTLSSKAHSPVTRILNPERIQGFSLVKDMEGNPCLLVQTETARNIFKYGQKIILYFVCLFSVGSLIFGITTLLLLERWVLSRLARLSGSLKQIGASGSLSERIVVGGNDELSALGVSANKMLSDLENSHAEILNTQAKLLESRQLVSNLMNNLPGMAYRCRNDRNWTMEFVSDGCVDLTGYSPVDLIGNHALSFSDLIHPDDQECVWNEVQAALREKRVYQLVYRITTADGEEKWVREQGRGIFSSEGELLTLEGFIADTTDSKLAEEAIMASEAKLSAMISGMDEGVAFADADNTISEINDYFCRFVGKQREEILGKRMEDLHQGLILARVLAVIDHYRNNPGSEPMVLQKPIGPHEVILRLQPIYRDGRYEGILLNVVNVTELVRAREKAEQMNLDLAQREEALRKANLYQQKILSTAVTAIFTVDTEMRITSVNEAFCSTTGFTEQEVVGQHCFTLKGSPCLDRCGLYDPTRQNPIIKKQCTINSKDGRRLTILKSADLIRDDSGKVIGGIESFVDVTELVEAREAAESASRTKSIFLANMSHEIRTPMNGILGMTELALETALSAEQRDYLKMVKISADSLLNILNDILDFSKIEAGKLDLSPTSFNLRDSLCETVASLQVRTESKGLELACGVQPEVPDYIIGDPGRLRQIVVNLVGNAIKFTEKGEIVVQVCLEYQTEHDICLHFIVRDTGIGIPQDKQAIIFDAFTQVDGSSSRKYDGTGLGLAISSQLVRMMGGKIWVESEEGKGSIFHFTIRFGRQENPVGETITDPCDDLSGLPPPTKDHQTGNQARMSLHILLAEDNPINQKLALRLLDNWGYSVHLANNGKEALAILEKEKIDLVLMDVQMPEMGGFEATAVIREREKTTGQHLPIIAMTAHAMKGDQEKCLQAGMDAYLSKPIQKEVMFKTIEQFTCAHTRTEG